MLVKFVCLLSVLITGCIATAAFERKGTAKVKPVIDVGLQNEQFLQVLGAFERKNKDVVLSDSLRCDSGKAEPAAFFQCDFQTSSGAVCKATRHSATEGKYRPYTVQCLDAKNQRRITVIRQRV